MKTSVIDLSQERSTAELMQALSAAFTQEEPSLVIVSTSGSSGITKRVQLSTKAIAISAQLSNSAVRAVPGDIWSLLLPIDHIAGLNVLARAIQLGSEIVDENARADFTAIVPTQLHRALNGDSHLLKHLQNCKAVLVGGAAIGMTILESARRQGINVITTYGMTETSGGCVYNNIPLPGISLALSESGLIKIKGAVIAMGYENQEALWAEKFVDGWFLTSDLGEIHGDEVFVIGRADDVIISGGINISLIAIENELAANYPEINFLATSIPDSEWGDKLCLISDQKLDWIKISDILENNLGREFVPKKFLCVDEIPKLGIGKPDRVKAAELFQNKQ